MKNLHFIFLLALLMSMVVIKAWAYDAQIEGIYYNFKGNEAEVTYKSSGDSNSRSYWSDVVIPSSVFNNGKEYIVTSIGKDAFYNCYGLISVAIPNTVTRVGDWAFHNCYGLTSVGIPNSVTSIGDWAFYGCNNLNSLTIPNSVISIGQSAFSGCSALSSVTIPNSVDSIGQSAFSGCSGLASIKVESGNTDYDSRENCNAIIRTSINELIAGCQNTIIPNSVTSIGRTAFYKCYGLTSVTIPNSVTTIGDYAFYGCI